MDHNYIWTIPVVKIYLNLKLFVYECDASFVRIENRNIGTLSVWTALLFNITNMTSWKIFEMCDVYYLARPSVIFISNPAFWNVYCFDSFTDSNGGFDYSWEHILIPEYFCMAMYV
jgi:hypothetical protein